MIKECLKKTGAVSGAKLEKVMFELNSMSRADKTGDPIDLFLGRSVNSLLPNAGNKIISIKKRGGTEKITTREVDQKTRTCFINRVPTR